MHPLRLQDVINLLQHVRQRAIGRNTVATNTVDTLSIYIVAIPLPQRIRIALYPPDKH